MDCHVIGGSQQAMFVVVVCHMDVVGSNALGVPFSTAIIASKYSSGKSALPLGDGTNGTIAQAELDQLAAGTRYEFTFQCPLPEVWDALTLTQKQTAIRNVRTAQVALKNADAVARLNYFGSTFN